MSVQAHNIPQADAATEVKRLQAELAEANLRWQRLAAEYSTNEARQRTLARLTHQLSGTRDETEAARLLECACRDLFHYDAFLLDAYDEDWNVVKNTLCLDTVDGVRQEVAPAFTNREPGALALKVIKEGPQLILRKPESLMDEGLQPFGDKARRSMSLMFAPVRNGGKVLGTLTVQSYRLNAYMQSDLDLLQVTADLCGGAFDRIRTEMELHAREQQYHEIVESTQEGVWVTDASGVTTFVNRRMAEMMGYEVEDMLGRTSFDFMFPENQQRPSNLEEERRKPHRQLDLRLRRKDGAELWVLVTANPMLDPGGKFSGTVGLLTDITERKRVEEELKESDARFHSFMDNLTGFAFIKDHEGRYLFVNSEWERTFGRRLAEIKGLSDTDLFPQAPAAVYQGSDVQLRAKKQPIQMLETIYHGAEPREYLVNKFLVPGDREGEEFIGGIAVDVTERIRMQQQLRAAEARSTAILNSALDAVVTIDEQGCVIEFNPAAERMFGYKSADVIGQRMGDLIVPEELRERHQQALEQCARTGEAKILGRLIELPAVRADGTRFPAELTINKVEHGPKLMFTGFIRDISARKEAEQEIRQLNATLERRVEERTKELEVTNKELESFCYSVSHDLRAPLRAIDGFSQALEEDYAAMLDASGKNYLDRVRKATKRMAVLIDDLLELSRITRAELKMMDVDLTQMARQVKEELENGQPDRTVEWVIAPEMRVWGDPRLLRVALDNLLGNAWKFTRKKEKPRIEFGLMQQKGSTVYFVQDNGAGFDMNYAGKLFGAFQRLHSAEEYEGTGVGLANVQRVIHRHGGNIRAEARVNEGASFYFTLSEPEKRA
ncbi:MAG TPA: PAS domain S-box protein [Verrucomicrobiae bacterium]